MSAYEIEPRVWFGAAEHTFNPDFMMQITHIVNCDDTPTSTNVWARAYCKFLHIPCEDNHYFQIVKTHAQTLFEFIDEALTNPDACVYIHCYKGLNRSAALAIAYAARISQRPANDIIANIRANSRPILTNIAFERQLLETYS